MPKAKLCTVCAPDAKVRRGYHKHMCPDCGTCWKHIDGAGTRDRGGSKGDFAKAHQCPECGTSVKLKYTPLAEKLGLLRRPRCDFGQSLVDIFCETKERNANVEF